MTHKTPADMARANYCYEHRIYFDSGYCPDCRLEEWATFHDRSDKEDFVRLKDI